MKHFELRLTKQLLLSGIVTFFLALVFFVINLQKAEAAVSSSIDIPTSYVNIGTPRGMVMNDDGNIWYVDSANTRIVLFDPDTNTILRTVGRSGSAEGEFDNRIYSITMDNDGYLYVLAGSNWVYKLDANGGYITMYDLHTLSGKCWDPRGIVYDTFSDSFFVTSLGNFNVTQYSRNNMTFMGDFGSEGTDIGEFTQPWGITTDSIGRIYVVDGYGSTNVQVFGPGPSYTPIRQITTWDDGVDEFQTFNFPRSVLVSADGTISVTSAEGEHVVVQFDDDGHWIRTWPFANDGRISDMSNPEFLVKDVAGNIYVGDYGLKSITKYSSTGVYANKTLRNNLLVEGKLYVPADVAYNGVDHKLYVLDGGSETSRINEFNNDGTFSDVILEGLNYAPDSFDFGPDGRLYLSRDYGVDVFILDTDHWDYEYTIGTFETTGSGNGEFVDARDVVFYNSKLYVADLQNHRVQIFTDTDEDGQYEYSDKITSNYIEGDPEYGNTTPGQLAKPQGLVINSTTGKLFVADQYKLEQFDATTLAWDGTVDFGEGSNYVAPSSLSIDSAGKLYVSDVDGNHNFVLVYDTSDADDEDVVLLETLGSFGSGQLQFDWPRGSAINPETGTLTIADGNNGRVESVTSGNRILNLIPSANVIIRTAEGAESTAMNAHAGESLSEKSWVASESEPLTAIPSRLMFGDYVVADFTVNLTTSRNWATVNVITLPLDSKSLVVNLNQTSAPGIFETHSLYVYRYTDQQTVTVCPDASTLDSLIEGCSGEYTLYEGDSNLNIISINGDSYWKIDGLTGTGAFSSLFETGFLLRDIMTRQQISTASNHEILFGTTYDITNSGDTITLSFDGTAWDLSTIHLVDGDLILRGGSTEFNLGDDAGTDIWGVNIAYNEDDDGLYKIVFTAPTDGDQYIEAGNFIHVFINNDALINPDTPGSYEIGMRLLTDNGIDQTTESGSVNVAIVDSDQVTITGFVNAFLSFDLDTTTPDSGGTYYPNCDADSCLPYEGASLPASNYTVDLGELMMTQVNISGFSSSHIGGLGKINSIYFDLSTNSPSGAVVTYRSLNGELRGPGHNEDPDFDLDIPSTNGSTPIVDGTSAYGIQMINAPTYSAKGDGEPVVNCGETYAKFCVMTFTASSIYTVTSPIADARGKIDVAAAIDGTVVPGNYADEITFIATATF